MEAGLTPPYRWTDDVLLVFVRPVYLFVKLQMKRSACFSNHVAKGNHFSLIRPEMSLYTTILFLPATHSTVDISKQLAAVTNQAKRHHFPSTCMSTRILKQPQTQYQIGLFALVVGDKKGSRPPHVTTLLYIQTPTCTTNPSVTRQSTSIPIPTQVFLRARLLLAIQIEKLALAATVPRGASF